MVDMLRSLDSISNIYSIFEKDQVLTEDQLNDVTQYLDDQNRLTRVQLIGVGIIEGLRVTLVNNSVRISKGLGITTDGDLICLNADTSYLHFRRYDESNPVYGPFYANNSLINLYELFPAAVVGERNTQPLTDFTSATAFSFAEMAVVALMESYAQDQDICSGTDCDNLGNQCINTLKFLLVRQADLGGLQANLQTPDRASRLLQLMVSERPLLSPNVTTLTQLSETYLVKCNGMHGRLVRELAKIYPNCSGFLQDLFPADPTQDWVAMLEAHNRNFGRLLLVVSAQSYYDFLKDVIETYNAFRLLLIGETALCCPDTASFSKHLLLGNLQEGAESNDNRIGFYPSPAIHRRSEHLDHARFLLVKLDHLIRLMESPEEIVRDRVLRITPSHTEQTPLEQRAIPYYYRFDRTRPLFLYWNYVLRQKRMERCNYSYHAAEYEGEGGAASPLNSSIGAYEFFRIEGHLGSNVHRTLASLQNMIRIQQLPFTVKAVALSAARPDIFIKPPIRYGDLHRFHYLVRQDLSFQLDETTQFSGKFKEQIHRAVDTGVVTEDGTGIKTTADQKESAIAARSGQAKTKLSRKYSQYKQDASWKNDITETLTSAGQFKYELGKVARTEFNTPIDHLIGNKNGRWLDWLDQLIQNKDDKQDERLLFHKFIGEHPAAEHYAGVTRGGTFVLVYQQDRVVADFMLPYYCCEQDEDEPDEPALAPPQIRPDWIRDFGNFGIKVIPSLDHFVGSKLGAFKTDIEKELLPKFETQEKYFSVVKDSVSLMGTVFGGGKVSAPPTGGISDFVDRELGFYEADMKNKRSKVDYYDEQLADERIAGEERAAVESKRAAAEQELARSMEDSAKAIAEKPGDIAVGGEAFKVVMTIAESANVIRDEQVFNAAKDNMANASAGANKPVLNGVVAGISRKVP